MRGGELQAYAHHAFLNGRRSAYSRYFMYHVPPRALRSMRGSG